MCSNNLPYRDHSIPISLPSITSLYSQSLLPNNCSFLYLPPPKLSKSLKVKEKMTSLPISSLFNSNEQKSGHSSLTCCLDIHELLCTPSDSLQQSFKTSLIEETNKDKNKRNIRFCAPYEHNVCPQCFRIFSRPSYLKIHIHKHTAERPYTCSVEDCKRSFFSQSNMKRHMHLHKL
ncbi:hypothetical protein T552_00385 [Pneumocystis carinii B80]|uniref:C2H2-type domain-containing protein n=1 Tax=Pneumocystis carinii (strain B80) TaxID=1408658 RepID=A0A0W4ZQM3_PNEC8|nr:hypothetical protein T552_00385 [Pneumocystis carinii B80]KTW30672.1 hypothetical protein T552_00385 [Pneumocystis carinii B80]